MAYALSTWTLSLTQLRRLRFPVSDEHEDNRNIAVRTVLAALAIYALALQREHGYWLRSRCELVPFAAAENGAVVVEQIKADGTAESFHLPNAVEAKALLNDALREATASNEWERKVIRLTPTEQLKKLIDMSDGREPELEDEEAAVTDDAGDQG